MVALRIICDEREVSSGIPRLLVERGIRVDKAQMPTADYLLAWNTAVERKTVTDFVHSLFDGRLFDQCSRLSEEFDHAVLLIEGNHADVHSNVSNAHVVAGAVAALCLDFKLKLVYSSTKEESASILEALAKRLAPEKGERPMLFRKKKKTTSLESQQLSIVASVPNVGPRLARKMLEKFGSPRAVLTAGVAEIGRVKGIGFKRAARVVRVLTEPFPDRRSVKKGTEKQSRIEGIAETTITK